MVVLLDQIVIRVPVDVKFNCQPPPPFSQPQAIGEYAVTRERRLVLGREKARYLYEDALANGGEEEDDKMDLFLDWIVSQAPCGGPLKKVLHEADFVCRRGVLVRIASTAFDRDDTWEFVAARVKGVIFLRERDTELYLQRKYGMSEMGKLMTYWGHKFEHYMTVTQKGEKPKIDKLVTRLEEFDVVVRSTLGASFREPLRLVCCAEVDAIDKDGRPVELKTQRHQFNSKFWKYKSMGWWLQSFLFGIENIIVGYRDDEGIVRKVESLQVSALRGHGSWSENVCMNLLSTVLSEIRELLAEGEGCIVHYERNNKEITIRPVAIPDIDFFTRNFRNHFNLY